MAVITVYDIAIDDENGCSYGKPNLVVGVLARPHRLATTQIVITVEAIKSKTRSVDVRLIRHMDPLMARKDRLLLLVLILILKLGSKLDPYKVRF